MRLSLFRGVLIPLLLSPPLQLCNFFLLRAIHRDILDTQVTIRHNELIFLLLFGIIGHLIIIVFILTNIFTILLGPFLLRIHLVVYQFGVFSEWGSACQELG